MMTSNRILPFLIFVTLISSMKCFVLQLQYNNSFELSKPGNDLSNEIAASQSTCRDDTQCAYGGICKDFGNRKNCVCKKGLEGDFCKVVIDCVRGKYRNCRGEKGTCLYTIRYEQAICACTEYQVLDEENNICKEVLCEKRSCHGGTCRVIGGVESCTCPPRHYLQEDTCIEMDKCEDGSHTCPEDSTLCVPIGEDFYCKCKAGYKLDNGIQENNKAGCRKINKCEDGSHSCPKDSTKCIPRGDYDYRCECLTGFKLKEGNTNENNKAACIKKNKCDDGSHSCPKDSTKCIPRDEYDYRCECLAGFKLKEGNTNEDNKDACIKINRCEDGSHSCPKDSTYCNPRGEYDYRCDCFFGYLLKPGNSKENNKDACTIGEGGQSCFPGTSIVLTHAGEKLMKDVHLGDEVASSFNQDGSLIFSPVIAFLHRDENMKSSFIQLKTESGSTLLVTDNHLVFRSTDQNNFDAVHADKVRVGDLVHTNKVGELSSKSTVTAIASQTMTGVFAPLTIDGTIVVNNILASCYAEVDSHTKAHMAFLPFRFHYYIMNAFKSLEPLWSIPLKIAEGDQSFRMGNIDSSKAEVLLKLNSQGIHWYPKMLCWLTNSNCK